MEFADLQVRIGLRNAPKVLMEIGRIPVKELFVWVVIKEPSVRNPAHKCPVALMAEFSCEYGLISIHFASDISELPGGKARIPSLYG